MHLLSYYCSAVTRDSDEIFHTVPCRLHPQVMDKEGARLTTYRFTSPSGAVFSYTVENDSEPGGGVEEMEAWEAEEASRDLWKKAARQQVTKQIPAPIFLPPWFSTRFSHPRKKKCVGASWFRKIRRIVREGSVFYSDPVQKKAGPPPTFESAPTDYLNPKTSRCSGGYVYDHQRVF